MEHDQFDSEETGRGLRLTEEETRQVIQRWQQERVEQGGLTDKPALADVAEGLDISIADVHRLLREIRAERQAEEERLAWEHSEAEQEQIRRAEEERRQAESHRQQAERERQQAEWARQNAEYERNQTKRQQMQAKVYSSSEMHRQDTGRRSSADARNAVGILVFIIWLCFFVFVVGHIIGGTHLVPQSHCYLDNKEIPCGSMPFPVNPSDVK